MKWTNVSIESALDDVMTAEEYSFFRHVTPYIFQLKKDDRELFYFGSPHVRDPKDPLFKKIRTSFNTASPEIVFVEGIHVSGDINKFSERIEAASFREIIEDMGESGFTLKLGVEKGIEWQSPEPSDENLYNHLLVSGFSKDEIFAWDVFHILPQYNRLMKKEGFKDYVQGFIERFKQATNWNEYDYSYERAIRIGEEILGHSVDVENEPDALDFIDPIPWKDKKDKQTVLNRISEASSRFRDKKIVSDIADALKNHKKIFIVYGASHAVMQEPALRKLFS